MRFLAKVILIIVLSFFAGKYFPWWSNAIVAFFVGLILSRKKKRRMFSTKKEAPPPLSFLVGFLSLFALWGFLAWQMDQANASRISTMIAELISSGSLSAENAPLTLVSATALIGGLVGGFSTMTGNLLGVILKG